MVLNTHNPSAQEVEAGGRKVTLFARNNDIQLIPVLWKLRQKDY